jgi:hypothetical protein
VSNQEPHQDPEVQDLISRHLGAIYSALEDAGAPEGHRFAVVDDVRSQISEMIGDKQPTVLEIRQLLAEMDAPESYAAGLDAVPDVTEPEKGKGTARPKATPLLFILSVLFPAGVLAFESYTGYCAGNMFDPIPTIWHVLLVALVPIANLFGFKALRTGKVGSPRLLLFANGAALGVTIFYTLLFLPVMPFAVFAILILGMGLLPLSPLFSLIGTAVMRKRLKAIAGAAGRGFPSHIGWGVGTVLIALLMMYGQEFLTNSALGWTAADDPSVRARGMAVLRSVGSEDALLRACYGEPRGRRMSPGPSWWPGVGHSTDQTKQAREVYYRMTGRSFTSVPPPANRRTPNGEWVDWLEVNPSNRDGSVGAVEHNLLLNGSRMDAIVDGDAGVGYVEWTMTFENRESWAREGRAQIALPPGAVVSRLTLWVNGEEREAAFARRGKVTEAYENIVRQKRDPVIVTTSGNDRVLMKCFPVPANGQLKTRIGITVPLNLVSRGEVEFTLPMFLDRNFAMGRDASHSVWVEVAGDVKLGGAVPLKVEHGDANSMRVTGKLSGADLDSRPVITVLRSDEPTTRTFADLVSSTTQVIEQEVKPGKIPRAERIVVVVDGSISMEPHRAAVEEALSALPMGSRAAVIVASAGETSEVGEFSTVTEASLEQMRKVVGELSCQGGQDNVPALEKALALLGEGKDGLLVWIHGPQPVIMKPLDTLLQGAERSNTQPIVYELQIAPGRDSILPEWDLVCDINKVPRGVTLGDDLKAFLAMFDGNYTRLAWNRQKRGRTADDATTTPTRSDGHVARLWAFDEVRRMAIRADWEQEFHAVELATAYQLVTPLTGAVVLENQQMFDDAGLTPVDASTVPTIPEPETWALIFVALAVGLWMVMRGRRTGVGTT